MCVCVYVCMCVDISILKPTLFGRYYDQDLALARDLEDRASMGRAYCNLGLAHLALGNLDSALECQKYFLGNQKENSI